MLTKFMKLSLVAFLAYSFVPSVESCDSKIVDGVISRINSYKGNKFNIPEPHLCELSMILECKEENFTKIDLVDMTFSNVLPLEFDFRLNNQSQSRVKRQYEDPTESPRETITKRGTPSGSDFIVEGTIKFSKKGDPKEYTEKFRVHREANSFDIQITCLAESTDTLDTVYVELASEDWITSYTDCTADSCTEIENIIDVQVGNSFTVALAKVIDKLGTSGTLD